MFGFHIVPSETDAYCLVDVDENFLQFIRILGGTKRLTQNKTFSQIPKIQLTSHFFRAESLEFKMISKFR